MKTETEHSFRHTPPFLISSKNEFIQSFHWKDQHLVTPPIAVQFPLKIQYYFSWVDPSGAYAFMLFKRPNWDTPKGMVFRRNAGHSGTANLCDWCHSYGSSNEITMLSVKVNSKLTIGQYLCSRLDCLEKLETQIGTSGKSFEALAENVCDKIHRFFENVMASAPGTRSVEDEE